MFHDPFFKKAGIVIAILFIIGLAGMAASPKCPGCGKNWEYGGYCFGCQARQAQSSSRYASPSSGGYGSSNSSSNSGSAYRSSSIRTSCAYQSCPDYALSGSRYCSRHTCKVDGCNEKVKDPIIGYCSTHDRTETCIEPGCHGNKYKAKNSDYCTIHYGDHLK